MKLMYQDLNLQLGEPFVSNKGRVANIQQILVFLHWQGWIGLGTAVFDKEYGMVAEKVRMALEICEHLIVDASPFQIEQVLDRLEQAVPDQPTAIAAIDMALHDLLGQIVGLPLHHLWGLAELPIKPTGLSLGALPEAELLERSIQLSQWPILKLKLTEKSDIHLVGRLRNVYAGRIWIDGNGSWTVEEAISAAAIFQNYGVELLEQPILAGTPDRLRYIRERSPIPIVADEDCRSAHDILKLQGCADVINLKLLKCGGLRRGREMIQLAHHLGLKVMLGCKTESVIGITAIAQLSGLADYLDLDGHLDIRDDPYIGITVCSGQITLPKESGIGITLRQGVLK